MRIADRVVTSRSPCGCVNSFSRPSSSGSRIETQSGAAANCTDVVAAVLAARAHVADVEIHEPCALPNFHGRRRRPVVVTARVGKSGAAAREHRAAQRAARVERRRYRRVLFPRLNRVSNSNRLGSRQSQNPAKHGGVFNIAILTENASVHVNVLSLSWIE